MGQVKARSKDPVIGLNTEQEDRPHRLDHHRQEQSPSAVRCPRCVLPKVTLAT